MQQSNKLNKHILLLTFDYELFLGKRSGTAQNCILTPTEKTMAILTSFQIRNAIFFVDTLYLLKIRENPNANCQADYAKITDQIKRVKAAGHYVFPHLHPHWLDAVYLPEINQWSLADSTKYNFSAVSSTEQEYIFSKSIELLEELVGRQDVLGYRAGGWCIQPFESFRPFFIKYNIKYDFSVLRGYTSDSSNVHFNFKDAPDKICYRFEHDVCKEAKNGQFKEIPISQIKLGKIREFVNEVWIKILYKMGIKNYGDGLSHAFKSLRNIENGQMVSLELLTRVNTGTIFSELKKTGFIHFISHPKMLNPHNINCLVAFLKKASKLDLETDFKNIKSDIN